MNLPNKITVSRILLIPLFLLFVMPLPLLPEWLDGQGFVNALIAGANGFIIKYGNYIGALIFLAAASTDGVDGYVARKKNQVTRLGIFLDPIADKLMIAAALIALVTRNEISGWAAIIIISRELIVSGFRIVAAGEGVILAAGKWGKIKTVAQITAVVATLIRNFPLSLITGFPFHTYFMLIAVILTIYSGYDYISRNIGILKKI